MRTGSLILVSALLGSLTWTGCTADVPPTTAGRFDDTPTTLESDVKEAKPAAKDDGDDAVTADVKDAPAESEDTKDVDALPSSPTTNTCATAKDLGTLVGDTDKPKINAQGTCSQWLKVRITEADKSVFANNQKVEATLVSPEGADFDLYVYMNKENDVTECSKASESSVLPASRSDVVQLTWGEEWTANNTDDSRTLAIEVRAKDAKDCGKGNWVLTLTGNSF